MSNVPLVFVGPTQDFTTPPVKLCFIAAASSSMPLTMVGFGRNVLSVGWAPDPWVGVEGKREGAEEERKRGCRNADVASGDSWQGPL